MDWIEGIGCDNLLRSLLLLFYSLSVRILLVGICRRAGGDEGGRRHGKEPEM